MKEKIAILDCGGQYTKVIDRRVREAGVYSDIFPIGIEKEKLAGYSALILSGGPSSVWSEAALKYDEGILNSDARYSASAMACSLSVNISVEM